MAFSIIINYKLAKSFNKSEKFSILNIIFPSVLWPIIAFDESKYNHVKPIKKKSEYEGKNPIKIKNVIKWVFTIILLYIAISLFIPDKEVNNISNSIVGIFFLIYAIMLCPTITRITQKYSKYVKIKKTIIIILIMINILLMGILPF